MKLAELLKSPHYSALFEKTWRTLRTKGVTKIEPANIELIYEAYEELTSKHDLPWDIFACFLGTTKATLAGWKFSKKAKALPLFGTNLNWK